MAFMTINESDRLASGDPDAHWPNYRRRTQSPRPIADPELHAPQWVPIPVHALAQRWAVYDLDNCLADDKPRLRLIDASVPNGDARYEAYHAASHADEARHADSFSRNVHRAFFTARPEKFRQQTHAWIERKLRVGVGAGTLFMRPNGCRLGSVELKRAMLRSAAAAGANIVEAYDDRQDVCEMYIAEGVAEVQRLAIHEDHDPALIESQPDPAPAVRGHRLYKTGDGDCPRSICDRNGEVVLGLCRDCGLAEVQLLDTPICPGPEEMPAAPPSRGVDPGRDAEAEALRIAPHPAPVPERLRDAALLFESRNGAYGDAYKRFGGVLAALFPEGLHLRTAADFGRFALYLQSVGKAHRYAANFAAGGHSDSLQDATVYNAMLAELDELAGRGAP